MYSDACWRYIYFILFYSLMLTAIDTIMRGGEGRAAEEERTDGEERPSVESLLIDLTISKASSKSEAVGQGNSAQLIPDTASANAHGKFNFMNEYSI